MIITKQFTDGRLRRTARNIQKEIVSSFSSNNELKSNNLCVVKIIFRDEGVNFLDINYLLMKETKNTLGIEDKYYIDDEKDEVIIEVLNKLIIDIDIELIDKYIYLESISEIWSKYLQSIV